MEYACTHGADMARISLNKSTMDSIAMLDGEIDKVTRNADCSIYMYLFVNGRYGTFSTDKLDKESLSAFIGNAIDMVGMLGEDRCWQLPSPERLEKGAVTGNELGLYDPEYERITSGDRIKAASAMPLRTEDSPAGYEILCEESEYSDSLDDNYVIDSQGFEGRHTETSFTCFSEVTVQDPDGHKYSGYWWDAAMRHKDFRTDRCSGKALEKAVSQIGPRTMASGRYSMVLDTSVSSRLVSPILGALSASAIQQKVSFLEDSLDKKIFHEGMTLMDMARTSGKPGSRLFDTEGVATSDSAVIENGVVRKYFVNTYMAAKMEIAPTIEDISRPCLKPFASHDLKTDNLKLEENTLNLEDILTVCGKGIYVTGFNGGNCNSVTGDFSFGIEGFYFENGMKRYPIKPMVITGNIIDLWNNLIAAGNDARPCTRWQIPSVAFADVSFSA